MAINYFLVAIGGAAGAISRFGLAQVFRKGAAFPFTTFCINVAGSLLIGILFGLLQQGRLSEKYWALLAVGLCGGFTTFSSFSLDNLLLLQQHKWLLFALYALGSMAVCLAAVYLGYKLSDKF